MTHPLHARSRLPLPAAPLSVGQGLFQSRANLATSLSPIYFYKSTWTQCGKGEEERNSSATPVGPASSAFYPWKLCLVSREGFLSSVCPAFFLTTRAGERVLKKGPAVDDAAPRTSFLPTDSPPEPCPGAADAPTCPIAVWPCPPTHGQTPPNSR